LVLIAAGGGLILRQTAGRPTDAEIDAQFHAAALSGLQEKALTKLGLDLDDVALIDPVLVGGYRYFDSRQVKRGKDGIDRASECEAVAIFFGEQELHSYKYEFSLVADKDRELTDVYFYRDVVSVSTKSSTQRISIVGEAQPQPVKSEVLVLTTSGGTAVQCVVNSLDDKGGRDIQAARQLVRDKKLHSA